MTCSVANVPKYGSGKNVAVLSVTNLFFLSKGNKRNQHYIRVEQGYATHSEYRTCCNIHKMGI